MLRPLMVPLLLSHHTLRSSAQQFHMQLLLQQFHMLPLNLLMVLTVLNMPLKSSVQQFHMLPSPQFLMLPLNLLMVHTVLNMPLKSSAQQFHMPLSPLLLHQSLRFVEITMWFSEKFLKTNFHLGWLCSGRLWCLCCSASIR
jgi:hypothetical protein